MAFAVVDSSFILAWGLEETGFEAGTEVLANVVRHGGLAPAPWATEVVEGLRKAVARQRLTLEKAGDVAERIFNLGVTQDALTWQMAWRSSFGLARVYGLSVYDASYLELASRKGLPLVTLDASLRAAARKTHVFVLPQLG